MSSISRLAWTIAALGGLALGVVLGAGRNPRTLATPEEAPPVPPSPVALRTADVPRAAAMPRRLEAAPRPIAEVPDRVERAVRTARERIAAPGAAPRDVEPALRALVHELDAQERARLAGEPADADRPLPEVVAATELLRALGEERPALSAEALARLREATRSLAEPCWRDAALRSLATLGTDRDRAGLIEALRGPADDAARVARALRHAPAATLEALAWSLAGGGEASFENHLLVLIEAACRTDQELEDGLRVSARDALERAGKDATRDERTRHRIETCLAALTDDGGVPPVTADEPVPEAETLARATSATAASDRRRALYALGAEARPEAFEILASACTEDASPTVRAAGLRALRTYPPDQRRPVLAIVAGTDPSATVRAQATQELRDLGTR